MSRKGNGMKISNERKKELQSQYKQMRTDMGVIAVINKSNGKTYLDVGVNLKGRINRIGFQLKSGGHPNREMQKYWKELGREAFSYKVLEQLEYDEDESKIDYSDDLELLKMVWTDKLTELGVQFY